MERGGRGRVRLGEGWIGREEIGRYGEGWIWRGEGEEE